MWNTLRPFLFLVMPAMGQAHAQTATIDGRVVDHTGAPIPFVNIGVRSTRIGCVSDEHGRFHLDLPKGHSGDSITFSAIGHKTITLAPTDVMNLAQMQVTLPRKVYELPMLEVHPQAKRSETLGTHKGIAPGGTSIQSVQGGAAMALLIEPPEGSFEVIKASVTILENELDTFLLRFRFLGVDQVTGYPAEDLVHEDMILRSGIDKGGASLDLSARDIRLRGPFYLAVEWINDERTAELLRKREATRGPRIQGEIRNNKVVRLDEEGRVIEKRRLTDAELEQLEQSRVPRVYLRTRSGGRHTCLTRDASLSDWVPSSDVLVANVTIVQ